ncbi:hypothetical protein [Lysobacter antibioticus]|uniref:hypothetical protein n=1 Tax=Lysobacter antibioticus TaxID=84531 RepID=UPI001187505E|nr:hypothetical protein [Lysobacter antibioticus]
MTTDIEHIFPKDWIATLSSDEIEILRQAFDLARTSRLKEGARFDFFGGATLDLDSVFIPPGRGDALLNFMDEKLQAA